MGDLSIPTDVPVYKCLKDVFIAPERALKGSIIATWAMPGDHLEPLNAKAEEMLETWYTQEYHAADPETGKKLYESDGTKVMYRPHERFRPVKYEESEAQAMVILEHAAKNDMTGTLDLGRAQFAKPTNGELRPPPDPVHTQNGSVVLSSAPAEKPLTKAG